MTPARAGASFKIEHLADIAEAPGGVGWFEVHAENYMVEGGPRLAALEALRRDYPLSMHGVGLSLGSGPRPDRAHLRALARLVERYQPALVSEHLAWSRDGALYWPDLLPVPLLEDSLDDFVSAVDETQELLGREILIENPASYLPRPEGWIAEVDFLNAVARRTGAGLLIDLNNVYVSAANIGLNADTYIDGLAAGAIAEIHLAGHSEKRLGAEVVLIDDHGSAVADGVWALYRTLIGRIGARPTLIEWDTRLPAWGVLRAEAERAAEYLAGAADTA